ncbi:MAG TPA: hypothetical protein VE955_00460 [Candidatus Dormibacteraeota bacterium]|nr:hypothetical protein [Candidatus Dormibacteraeota bacterium]
MSASRKTLGGRGVEAIFSPDRVKWRPGLLIGLLAIVTGCTLSIIVIVDAYLKPFSTSILSSYSSLLASSIGLILMISGAGLCTTRSTDDSIIGGEMGEAESEKHDAMPNGGSSSLISQHVEGRPKISFGRTTRYGLIAFLESCLAIGFYSGLTDDYRSNVSMQQWVHAFFPAVRYLLSWEAVLLVSALLGLVMTQFVPGRAFAE